MRLRATADGRRLRVTGALLALVLVAVVAVTGWNIVRPTGRPPGGVLRISSGSTQGVYNAFASELAAHLRDRDGRLHVSVIPSTGSVQNLQRLGAGSADCAVTAGDAAALAVQGAAPFGSGQPIRAVARVYDDYIQLVAAASSGIRSVRELAGRRVSLGESGSGVALVSQRVLSAAGVAVSSMDARALSLTAALQQMAAGQLDAFFWSGGLPTMAVAQLIARTSAYLVPLSAYATPMGQSYDNVYRRASIPAGTYAAPAIDTIAVPNMLVCRADVPDRVVRLLTATLFADQSAIAWAVPPVNVMDQRTAIATGPVPLHPGALSWYRSTKR